MQRDWLDANSTAVISKTARLQSIQLYRSHTQQWLLSLLVQVSMMDEAWLQASQMAISVGRIGELQ